MFTEIQLITYFEQKNLSIDARKTIENIRTSDPSRRTSSGPRNVACRYPSKKMGCTIQAESHTNELAALYHWDHDEETHEFYDQPSRIKLRYINADNKKVTNLHTPDYFVIADNFVGWVECKTEEELIKLSTKQPNRYMRDESGKWRCPPGEDYANEKGLGYMLRSSAENDWLLIRNLTFLADYMDDDCPRPTQYELSYVSGIFKEKPWVGLMELVRDNRDQVSADAIYKMIVDGDIYFPIKANLITELEYAIVYRDEVSAKMYRLGTQTKAVPEITLHQPIQKKAGEKILWAGQACQIVNVSAKEVFITNSEGFTSTLSHEDFDAFIKESIIMGLPVNISKEIEDKAIAEIKNAGPVAIEFGVKRYNLINKLENEDGFARSETSIKTYKRKYREAEKQYGNGMIGLLPKIHKRGNRDRKLDQVVIDEMERIINERYLTPIKRTKAAVYGMLRALCKDKGLLPPSDKTFRKEIAKLQLYDEALARSGKRAAYQFEALYWRLDMETPRHGERPFEIAHIDHTQLDIELTDKKYGINYGRPWLSVMLDAYSRKVLAFWITFDEPSYRSCMMLIRYCVEMHQRVPRILVVDGGAEFDSVYFEGLISHLKIIKKSRAKSKARFGSVLERFFGITNTELVHNLSGNNQATKVARQCSPTHDPKRHAVWTLQTFTELFNGWVENVYEKNVHTTLGVSPLEAFGVGMLDSGMRAHKLISFDEGFKLLCLPTTKNSEAKIDNVQGVKINYLQYWNPDFSQRSLHNQKVPVKFDPDDASIAYAYINNQWVKCQSELVSIFKNRSIKQISLISNELRIRNRKMGTNRLINAETIGEYLLSAEKEEKIQIQVWRDQERLLALNEKLGLNEEQDVGANVGDEPIDEQELAIYGDF